MFELIERRLPDIFYFPQRPVKSQMSATDPVPIRFTSSSGVLSGLKEYLG